eukprot:Skav206173  [mRNA]  locus=scaffold3494:100787:108725:+ [translate_table: standard]
MGRITVLLKESITSCLSERVPSKCMSREASLWPTLHFTCVLLLHFVLTNVEQGQLSTVKLLGPKLVKTASSGASSTTSHTLIASRYVWRTFVSASHAELEASEMAQGPSGSSGGGNMATREDLYGRLLR